MQDDLNTRDLDYLVEGVWLGYIGHDHDVELVLCLFWVGGPDRSCFLLGPHGCDYAVAFGEELLKNVGSNEAGTA